MSLLSLFRLASIHATIEWVGRGVVGARIMNKLKNKTNFLLVELTSVNDGQWMGKGLQVKDNC